MYIYLLLALLSGFAPRGVEAIPAQDVRTALLQLTYTGDDETAIQLPAHDPSQLPEFPAEVEEEVRDSEAKDAQDVVAARKRTSFLADLVVSVTCFPGPPSPVHRARQLPPAGTELTVLYRVFRI
ncbi:hypothetical protein CLV84_0173 [Neolewinella xylanilytica]|uniref:Uncharacterized protein n=1 Tax=Neolewinella xylanilytica TaxID=1514080 RepID=A0A2S6I6V0_9BACT|nr:hypothetical protein [Neolewinella xylanilytica]PPK87236.1 hypothetical protein CLV84_0173 [Neolewinella xylanilytica]